MTGSQVWTICCWWEKKDIAGRRAPLQGQIEFLGVSQRTNESKGVLYSRPSVCFHARFGHPTAAGTCFLTKKDQRPSARARRCCRVRGSRCDRSEFDLLRDVLRLGIPSIWGSGKSSTSLSMPRSASKASHSASKASNSKGPLAWLPSLACLSPSLFLSPSPPPSPPHHCAPVRLEYKYENKHILGWGNSSRACAVYCDAYGVALGVVVLLRDIGLLPLNHNVYRTVACWDVASSCPIDCRLSASGGSHTGVDLVSFIARRNSSVDCRAKSEKASVSICGKRWFLTRSSMPVIMTAGRRTL
jgi:hypothetical protein